MNNKEKFYLIDGSSYIFRAFYAVAPLTTKDGFPTNALFGFTRMMTKLLKDLTPSIGAVVFDAGKETFRTELYPLYKANRKECPPELVEQMPYFRSISKALGFNVLALKGYEADDILGTLADKLSKAELNVILITPDKDLLQLVNDQITVFDPMKDKHFDYKGVEEKLGVKPEQVVDYLTLTGDASDNIPGVAGVGPKTATQLLQIYGTLENIINNLEEIKSNKQIRNRNSIVESFVTSKEQIPVSRKLAEVFKDIPLNLIFEDGHFEDCASEETSEITKQLTVNQIDFKCLTELADRFEFSSLVAGLPRNRLAIDNEEDNKRKSGYLTVNNENYKSWLENFLQQKIYAIDLETTSLDPKLAKIVGVAICWANNEAFYLPFLHVNDQNSCLDWSQFLADCNPSLSAKDIKKVGQNIKYDFEVFAENGVELKGIFFDTMIASYLLDSERRSYSLDALANDYLNIQTIKFEDITSGLADFSYLDIATATKYAAEDAHVAWLLYEKLAPNLADNSLQNLFDSMEMPLVVILAKMELAGVLLDSEYLIALSKEFTIKIDDYENRIAVLAGEKINFNSTKQLSELLFNKLGIPTKGLKKTKSGISTDSSVLEKLKSNHPIAELILEYRMYTKLKNTFIDTFIKILSPKTGRVHASFHQTGTSTGRLSSSDPNLQNIPIQTTEGRRIREAFIAPPDHVLISADYSQIELRILAEMSGDQNLIQTFMNDEDIHERTSREIFNLNSNDSVSKDQRRVGKTMNFGIIYGMGAFRLSKELGISYQEATSYIELYFARYPEVQKLFLKLENDAISKGYVETLFGRRRYIRNLDTTGRDEGFLARVAINAPLQGTAADLIKLSMIALHSKIYSNENTSIASLPLKLVLQIHDELVFECPAEVADEMSQVIKNTMENVVTENIVAWSVPLRADTAIGKNWEESKS